MRIHNQLINTKLNPADSASRGISTKARLQIQWITEPEFLWKSEKHWPENLEEIMMKVLAVIQRSKPKCFPVQITINDSSCVLSSDDYHTSLDEIIDYLDKFIDYHSSWYKCGMDSEDLQ